MYIHDPQDTGDSSAGNNELYAGDPRFRQAGSNGFEVGNSEMVFAPKVYPENVVVSKERNVTREENLCKNESVEDAGSKNREILVTGIIRQSEKVWLDALLDSGGPHDLIADEWTGEVQLLDGEYRKIGLETYRYKISLLSTGRDEEGGTPGTGILDMGSVDPNVLDGFDTRVENANNGVETGL